MSNLLDMSRIEAGELRPTTAAFVLDDLIESAIARSTVRRRERPVEVRVPVDLPPVEVDDDLVRPGRTERPGERGVDAGDDARIRVVASQVGGSVTVTIEDDGPGVPDASMPRLFEKFFRVPRAAEGARRGTGTGLAVVRGLVDAMGGSAVARRSELGGLAVDLVVPVARIPADAEHRAATDERPRGRGCPDARGGRHGHEPGMAANRVVRVSRFANSGTVADALAAFESACPDLIVLDLGSPDADGSVVVRHVRREATTPILIVSARDREVDKIAALEAGADDFVTKPVGMGEVARSDPRIASPRGGSGGRCRWRRALGALGLDATRRSVTVDGREVHLTPREYEVLKVLVAHAGRLVTHGRLLRAVWGTRYADEAHYIHVYVSQIRRKLAAADPDALLQDLLLRNPVSGTGVAAVRGRD